MVHVASRQSEWTDRADAIFPGQNHAEKEGSFLNKQEIGSGSGQLCDLPVMFVLNGKFHELLHIGTATPVQQTPQFSRFSNR